MKMKVIDHPNVFPSLSIFTKVTLEYTEQHK